ncbi:type I secretion system permease/ATPase [Algihabitans albus]|uniref:type I secretion system permease/ATPase n=1 Tax=Algihabitans albus TaxID=2164067 RepID=UPI0035CE9C2A
MSSLPSLSPSHADLDPAALGRSEPDDPLLACLVFLTKHFGRPRSAMTLLAGLPLTGAPLTPELFLRAAENAGFAARVVRRSLDKIHPWTLPAVLVLNDGDALVLQDCPAEGDCGVILPAAGGGESTLSRAQLAEIYSGYAIFVRPSPRFAGAAEGGPTVGRASPGATPRAQAWFWGTFAENWWTYLQVALASVLINLFALANPLFTMTIYDRVLPNNAVETAMALAVGVASVFFFDFLLRMLRGWFLDFVGRRADVILASRIFDQLLDMKLSHRPQSSGGFASTLREFESVRDFFTSATLAAFIDLPFALLFVAVIALLSPQIGLLLAAVVVLLLFWGLIIQIPIARRIRENLTQSEHKHGVLVESVGGLETIKVVGAQGRMRRAWEELVGQSADLGQKIRLYNNLGVQVVHTVQQLTAVCVVLFGVFLVQDGLMTAGGLIACVILSGRAIGPLAQVSQMMMRFHQTWSSLKSLDAVMRYPVDRPAEATFLHRPELQGGLVLEGVGFRYPNSQVEVLQRLGFSVQPGERVGIVGRVGSGKTTVAKLAAGLYEPTEGAVRLDGVDIRQIEPSDLRANLGFVPQDLFLFRGTIRENLVIAAPHASDQEVIQAARAVGLHDFIVRHPLGYDLPVGERGEGLSGGQRQAVALARVLLKRPNLLLLDEPTSAMDNRSEEQILRNLPLYLEGKTILLITHRISLLRLVDRVLVLDGGRLVIDGPRDEVLARLAEAPVAVKER